MKKLLSVLFIVLTTNVFAYETQATIYFVDGKSETGQVASFLESKATLFQSFKSFESVLNLDDQVLKFKSENENEFRKIQTNQVERVVLHLAKGNIDFRAVKLAEFSSNGQRKEKVQRIFLPIVREGLINIYGYRVDERSMSFGFVQNLEMTFGYYYQNSNSEYVVSLISAEPSLSDMIGFKTKFLSKLRFLFGDCKEIDQKIDQYFSKGYGLSKEEKKAMIKKQQELQDEYDNLPREKKKDIMVAHAYQMSFLVELIDTYEYCN